ncbi:uncharacterized protein LOC100898961 [Galendromus occidentalis]|uniref:Uncharacterized protein LOC100898961 n=1 Tax=Galendromus occidentalis TaxID=34638 RepID=A0AAJ7WJG6_9ACAR|nr:uncharacterized protein LOC100898961 [Galendromus occidentalis]
MEAERLSNSESAVTSRSNFWCRRFQDQVVRLLGVASSVPPWRKSIFILIIVGFLLNVADLLNRILIFEESLPEKKLILTLIFFTPSVRIPYLISRNHTKLRENNLMLPSLRDRFYELHYKRKVNDAAANYTIALGQHIGGMHSRRCSRALFLTPRVVNLKASTALLYQGYYGLQDTPPYTFSRRNVIPTPEDRNSRWNLRNQMAEQNEANLYTITFDGRSVAAYIRFLNRKAREEGLFTQELDNGSNVLDLLLFQHYSEGKELPAWADLRKLNFCYDAIIRTLVKGFEQKLAKRILEDVLSRLHKLKNDLPSYNVVFYATDYEELLGLDKYLNIVLPFQFVYRHGYTVWEVLHMQTDRTIQKPKVHTYRNEHTGMKNVTSILQVLEAAGYQPPRQQ